MNIDAEKLLEQAIQNGIRVGIEQQMTRSYQNPIEAVIKDAIEKNGGEIRQLLTEAIASTLKAEEFRAEVKAVARTQLAKVLVQRFGGELEKRVNDLKSDPAMRARITLAIEEIVKSKE